MVARVRPGIDISAAYAELSRVSRAMKVRYGSETMMVDAVAVPILDVMTAGVRPALRLLLAASFLLLLVVVHQRLEPAGGAGGVAAARIRRPARRSGA